HAHAVPSQAGSIEAKSQPDRHNKDDHDNGEDSDDPWIPGAFIWDKIMHHHHKKR
ncbi:5051_t:CDS:1, partial [Acaulospora colombiana]